MEQDDCCQISRKQDPGDKVLFAIPQRMHPGSSTASVITARFHGQSQIISSADGCDKEGDQQGNQPPDPGDQLLAVKVSASGLLSFHNALGLLRQNGDKAQGDGHHHSNFMNRNMQPVKASEACFKPGRQLVWRGGQCHQRGTDHQVGQAENHVKAQGQAFHAGRQGAKLKEQGLPAARKEVHEKGQQDDDQDRPQPPHHKSYGYTGADHAKKHGPGDK